MCTAPEALPTKQPSFYCTFFFKCEVFLFTDQHSVYAITSFHCEVCFLSNTIICRLKQRVSVVVVMETGLRLNGEILLLEIGETLTTRCKVV